MKALMKHGCAVGVESPRGSRPLVVGDVFIRIVLAGLCCTAQITLPNSVFHPVQ